ncbi:MAG: hypothetical protein JNK15_24010 [Planctomycetes bacterium]|nr:hypothetical protein [Planctomycetota bacterium]
MLLKALFWSFAALDALGIGLWFLLGLAAAGPSKTHPLSVAALLFVLPGALLAVAVLVFVRTQTEWLRLAAFAVVSSPALFLAVTQALIPFQLARLAGGRMWGSTDLTSALQAAEQDPARRVEVRTLLQQGADPNEPGEQTPLVLAIYGARHYGIEPVQWLLDAGADPNRIDAFGSPNWFAATAKSVAPEVFELLLARGADLQAKGQGGCGGVWGAINTENWPLALRLVEAGAYVGGISPMGLPLAETIEGRMRGEADVDPRQRALLAAVRRRG